MPRRIQRNWSVHAEMRCQGQGARSSGHLGLAFCPCISAATGLRVSLILAVFLAGLGIGSTAALVTAREDGARRARDPRLVSAPLLRGRSRGRAS